ncbi:MULTISPECIES: TetR/AcrR family transcriptional regulator [unclassified Variovorax]|uniref:TetR/AcrR family transcriptional regulator n=1 Tax=unclassified Variovorax TaxID=663243 RepID=UPI003F46C159
MSNDRSLAELPQNKGGRPRGFDRDQALTRALDVFWRRGYELAPVAELCSAMGINPPSLYAAFGNKSKLFLEAVDFYEHRYWDATWEALEVEPDIHQAVANFFDASARILLSPQAPCGCLVALAAVSVSDASVEVREAIDALRREGKALFVKRLKRAVKEGQLPAQTELKSLAGALNTMLEGLSIQARDGLSVPEMRRLAAHAVRLLPTLPENTP